jgi:transcriptional regulator with XRE-family HTH domain
MDEQQRRRAGRAVAAEMDRQGLTVQKVADMSGVAAVTIRDLCNGKRWPWTQKRNAIERALTWPTGRIAQIAKGNEEYDADDVVAPTDLPVHEALDQLLRQRSPLSRARRAKLVATYLELVEDQERADEGGGGRGPRRDRAAL